MQSKKRMIFWWTIKHKTLIPCQKWVIQTKYAFKFNFNFLLKVFRSDTIQLRTYKIRLVFELQINKTEIRKLSLTSHINCLEMLKRLLLNNEKFSITLVAKESISEGFNFYIKQKVLCSKNTNNAKKCSDLFIKWWIWTS